ncbi:MULTISPECIES: hypothetical protein [Nitrosomonas]|uniref:Inner membrane protein n=1 Tax=Nitrosomonas communis TaxID=44574 RepID=A0A0F7KEJ4_9PROT|nr:MULTISPECIES: hypothetical protein [Nitrosomonas]AKH37239.1 hypothetical protein AAW31_04500 [Nitrosomonas communis]TYP73720.1 hypothetical protein BCL69_109111 [Nitrosomonas communis]UVS62437.1 hypothetical protein NX761_04690 [Nitrosomonas sp. PLL12]SDX16629.1 hypothetical protein SAMN05421882_10766 [Nitrosomonas communis]
MYSLEDLLNIIQWLAMVTTITATWYVAAERKDNRNWGFWLFLLSNLLWFIWAIPNRAWALATMQVILAGMNIRGVKKSELKQAKKSKKVNAK